MRSKQVQKHGLSSSYIPVLNSYFLVISVNNYNHSHKYIYMQIHPLGLCSTQAWAPYLPLVMSSWWDSTSTLHNLISLMFMKILWRQNPYINAKNYNCFLHLIPTAQFLFYVFNFSKSVKESLCAIPLTVLQNLIHIFSWGRHWHWLVLLIWILKKLNSSYIVSLQ